MFQTDDTKEAGGPLPSPATTRKDPSSEPTNCETVEAESRGSHYLDWPNDAGFHHLPQDNKPTKLAVTGSFPPWVAGTLLRVGPGARKTLPDSNGEAFEVDHWFDGFATCHRFELHPEDGEMEITYSSRGLQDVEIEKARKTKRWTEISFGQKYDPCESLYKKLKTVFTPYDINEVEGKNVGVAFTPSLHKAGQNVISVTSDQSALKEIDPVTLQPKSITNQKDLHPKLKGPMSSAHPCVDPVTGDVYNYNMDFGPRAVYNIFRTVADTGKTDILASISGNDIKHAYIHSLFLTENFVILCIWPAFFVNKGIDILWKRSIFDAIGPFDKSAGCTWVVVDRVGKRGVVKKYTSPAMFCFHTVNAWEQEGADSETEIIADLVQFENLDVLHQFYYQNLISTGPGVGKFKTKASLARYQLSRVPREGKFNAKKDSAKVLWSLTEPICGDMPIINPRNYTKPYKYVYTTVARGKSSFWDSVEKTNTVTGEHQLWFVDKHTPSEPIFVPRPAGTEEDDGVLLIVVLDGTRGTSYLVCLDARDLSEIARANVPVPVTFGLHGVHLPRRTP